MRRCMLRRIQADHGFPFFSTQVSGCKTAAVTQIHELSAVRFCNRIIISVLCQQIEIFPVDRRHTRSISSLLHPAFDFQRTDSGICQLRQKVNRTQILRAERIQFPARIKGCLALLHTIRKTARLRTPSAVAAPAAKHTAKQALSGVAITDGTMHETF